jgi:hypothetical protein
MAENPVTYRVGDVTITRVMEKLIGDFTPEYLLPEWEPLLVQEHQEWMASSWWDDAREHFVLSAHTRFLKTPAHTMLVDTGIGNDKKRKLPSFDHLNEPYLERLAAVGVTPDVVYLPS